MDRWDWPKKENKNLVLNESLSYDEALITNEEQALVLGIARILQERSLRYYIVVEEKIVKAGDNEIPPEEIKTRASIDYYMATAALIYKAAKKLSEAPGGKGYGSHSLKTWIAIIMGPNVETFLQGVVDYKTSKGSHN